MMAFLLFAILITLLGAWPAVFAVLGIVLGGALACGILYWDRMPDRGPDPGGDWVLPGYLGRVSRERRTSCNGHEGRELRVQARGPS